MSMVRTGRASATEKKWGVMPVRSKTACDISSLTSGTTEDMVTVDTEAADSLYLEKPDRSSERKNVDVSPFRVLKRQVTEMLPSEAAMATTTVELPISISRCIDREG